MNANINNAIVNAVTANLTEQIGKSINATIESRVNEAVTKRVEAAFSEGSVQAAIDRAVERLDMEALITKALEGAAKDMLAREASTIREFVIENITKDDHGNGDLASRIASDFIQNNSYELRTTVATEVTNRITTDPNYANMLDRISSSAERGVSDYVADRLVNDTVFRQGVRHAAVSSVSEQVLAELCPPAEAVGAIPEGADRAAAL